uniref:Uncharacterized protein n=1 Tax=Terrapene triunguis TaxID=2587831 RepID=A0A674JZJ2_9SAUR
FQCCIIVLILCPDSAKGSFPVSRRAPYKTLPDEHAAVILVGAQQADKGASNPAALLLCVRSIATRKHKNITVPVHEKGA